MDIKPGTMVNLVIAAAPTTPSARKTLSRLCRRDQDVARRQRTISRKRPSWESWRRGGRQWHHQMRSQTGVKLEPGSRYCLLATVDMLRDLASVSRFVRVTPK